MRTFELSTHVKSISRGDGRSATAAAAYRACCEIECEREGRTHDYSRKQGLEHSEITLPDGAPAWATDRAKLWNAAELREKNGKRGKNAGAFKADAKTAREFMFSFPAELSQAGRLQAARTIARHLVEAHGIAADFAIHQPGADGDERNFHCHMMTTTRRLGPKGMGVKAREWDDLKEGARLAKDMRAFIAATLNAALKAEGQAGAVFVEHRSFKARGKPQTPTIHQGPVITNVARKQRGEARRAWQAEQKSAQQARHIKELAGLKVKQDFHLQAKMGELQERQRAGEAAIKRELEAQRQADQEQRAAGIRGIFRILTGRAGREAFERETRDGERVDMARQKIEALRDQVKQETRALITGQANDQAAMIDRHKREDGQMVTAFEHRNQLDRAAEVVDRKNQVAAIEQKRERETDQGRGRSIGRELSP